MRNFGDEKLVLIQSWLECERETNFCGKLCFPCAGTIGGGTEGSLRLVNGPSSKAGRLEIYHSGQWGTVCDDSFSDAAAGVACRQLGLGSSGIARAGGYYGQGSDPIWLDNVQCSGSELSLSQCSHYNWGDENCGHDEDVGVECSGRRAVADINDFTVL